jgi:solute carrier family 25 iron transporter 28/37
MDCSPLGSLRARIQRQLPEHRRVVTRLTDIDFDPGDLTTGKAMIAGAAAGVMEHVCMYPVDTIKTRLQEVRKPGNPGYRNVIDAFQHIRQHEGFLRLYRGITAVVLGAIPSHAVHFATYEYFKKKLGGDKEGFHPVLNGIAGGIATMAHDAVVTPLDVIKQRLQMYNSSYTNVRQSIRRVFREEGFSAFYKSYPTTVVINVPFMAVYFATYETTKQALVISKNIDEKSPLVFVVAGGAAGALAALSSNPLDVIKTRIQLHDTAAHGPVTVAKLARDLWKNEGGVKAFFKGTTARVLYFVPSAAICWTTYEGCKRLLTTF